MSADILTAVGHPIEFTDLEPLANPSSVVLVGASDTVGSVGARLTANVLDHSAIRGPVYLVNARRPEVHGLAAYSSVTELPTVPDVAVIVVAAEFVSAIVRDCAAKGIPFAAVLSSGFSEAGGDGVLLEQELTDIAHETGIRIYGPNCPGISNIKERIGLNFSPAFAADLTAGTIGVATQGGGLGRTLLQAADRGLGVSRWLSSGNEADLEISDFIYHLASSPEVDVIVAIIEGIRDGARFAAAALHARQMNKPIIAIKLGRSEYGRAAAMSHTTSMTGESAINSAVLAQLGVVEVDDISDLIDTAALFAQRRPGPDEKVAIYTYSGGTAALAADMIGANGLTLAEFEDDTVSAMQEALPRFGTHTNPVDSGTEVLAKPEMVRASLKPVLSDPNVGITLVPVPIEMGDTTATLAREVVNLSAETGATVLPIWMTDRQGEGYRILADNRLVPSRSLATGIKAVRSWVEAGAARAAADLDWSPTGLSGRTPPKLVRALNEVEAKRRLAENGVQVPEAMTTTSSEGARAAAEAIGFPVVMKVVSADIQHKTDAGGVRLGIRNADEASAAFDEILASVRTAVPDARIDGVVVEQMIAGSGYEAVLAVHIDPTFGPILTVGAGGILIELLKDAAHAMVPLSEAAALQLVSTTKLGAILAGQRGKAAADLTLLGATISRISQLAVEDSSIVELELNPLWISEDGLRVIALDSLLVVADEEKKDD